MGKSSGKKKKQDGNKSVHSTAKQNRSVEISQGEYDKDTAVFIAMSKELKEEGNRLFQRRDYEGALLSYDKALNLLPKNHVDVAYLRSNIAACYMQMGISNYPRAVHECNLALEVSPKYSKALIKRARCYEGLNRMELALRDLKLVLEMEPNNLTALELAERVKLAIESSGDRIIDHPVPVYAGISSTSASPNDEKEKSWKKKKSADKTDEKAVPKTEEENYLKKTVDKKHLVEIDKKSDVQGNKKKVKAESVQESEDKEPKKAGDIIEEKMTDTNGEKTTKNVKLVFGEDIRWAQLPENCSLLKLREVIKDRFPTSKAVLVKYKDGEGDMITITTNEELRWAESSAEAQAAVKLYIVEVSPEHDPYDDKLIGADTHETENGIAENVNVGKKIKGEGSVCLEEWIIQFAQLFKNYVGFSSDAYLDLHEVGVKLYSEAMEETVSCDDAMPIFDLAAEKFQEMAALALFNCGNVHMARARKRIHYSDGSTRDTELDQVKIAYDWAQQEYEKAGKKYVEALQIKPNFYEGYLAVSLQQFEQAKLSWYFVMASNIDLHTWSPTQVLDLYNIAEENIETGMQMWEELEVQCPNEATSPNNGHAQIQKMGFDRLLKDISISDGQVKSETIRSQINVLWGTMLYERSIMEFKLDLPVWQECLEVAVEKFELAGAPPTDITVMIKNHCSNDSALEGLGFRIDEIVQAWNDMDDAKRWYTGVPSFRLEPLLRRRVSKIYYALEQA